MPTRMKELWRKYTVCPHAGILADMSVDLPLQTIISDADEDGAYCLHDKRHKEALLYDVFEPTYIQDALTKPLNLKHLIFGLQDDGDDGFTQEMVSATIAVELDSLMRVYTDLGKCGFSRVIEPPMMPSYRSVGGPYQPLPATLCASVPSACRDERH